MKNQNLKVSLAVALTAVQLLATAPCFAARQMYHITLSGNVESMGHAYPGASIQIEVRPLDGQAVLANAIAGKDGHFHVTVAFCGSNAQHVDWKLIAKGGRLASLASEGRQILSRDVNLAIQAPLNLTEDAAFELAML